LGLEFGTGNVGPISQHALEHLKRRGIEPGNWNAGPPTVTDAEATSPFVRYPRRLTGSDLEQADHIVAMKEAEHRPLLARFQGWADRVEYWSVHDLDAAAPSEAMQELERLVRGLLRRLHGPTPSSEAA
jgi:protein-tyrosine phosphatase